MRHRAVRRTFFGIAGGASVPGQLGVSTAMQAARATPDALPEGPRPGFFLAILLGPPTKAFEKLQ